MPTPTQKEIECTSSHQRGSSECKALIDAATKDLFRRNAFRITGLSVDATTREVARQSDKLKMLAELGQDPHTQTAAFPMKPPPTLDEIREAIQRLKEPEKRMIDEFFWFWPEEFCNSQSDPAMQALAKGDSKTAIGIWAARENGDVSSATAKHNLALVYHVRALDSENDAVKNAVEADRRETMTNDWKGAFTRWETLVTNEHFWEQVVARIRQLNEPILVDFARRMRSTLPEALYKINAELALAFAESGKIELARLHIQFMRETNQGLVNVEKTAELVLTPARNRLKEQIQRARESAQQNPATAHEAARILIEHARPLLKVFDLFFGEEEHFKKELFDEAATTVVNCLVAYQRKTGDNEAFVKLLELTLPLAESIEVRQRIEENIGIGNGNLNLDKFARLHAALKSLQEGKENPRARLETFFNRDLVGALNGAVATMQQNSEERRELFDYAAIVLRAISLDAWNNHQDRQTAVVANSLAVKYATSSELKQRLAEDKMALQQTRYEADLTPIASAPSLSTINGIGFKLYGSTDTDPATGSYLSTYYFVLLFIPIFPICRYRVTSGGDSYRFFGKAPLRPCDKWHLAISIGIIIFFFILSSGPTSSSPSGYTPPSPAPSAPAYTQQSGAPSAPAYTRPTTVGNGNSGGNVYRVPSSVSSTLASEKAEIESERATIEMLGMQIETLGREIEHDRIYLDRANQFAVDEFNTKVDRYNALNQNAKAANAAFNEKVENYNAKLQRHGR